MITKILQNLIRAIAIIYLSSCLRPRQWATGEGWHRGWRKTAVYSMGPGQLSLGTFLAIWPNNSRMSWDIYVTTTTEFANVYGMKDGEGVWDAGAGAEEDADATTVMARAKMSGETSFRLHLVRFSVRCCYTSWALAPNYYKGSLYFLPLFLFFITLYKLNSTWSFDRMINAFQFNVYFFSHWSKFKAYKNIPHVRSREKNKRVSDGDVLGRKASDESSARRAARMLGRTHSAGTHMGVAPWSLPFRFAFVELSWARGGSGGAARFRSLAIRWSADVAVTRRPVRMASDVLLAAFLAQQKRNLSPLYRTASRRFALHSAHTLVLCVHVLLSLAWVVVVAVIQPLAPLETSADLPVPSTGRISSLNVWWRTHSHRCKKGFVLKVLCLRKMLDLKFTDCILVASRLRSTYNSTIFS